MTSWLHCKISDSRVSQADENYDQKVTHLLEEEEVYPDCCIHQQWRQKDIEEQLIWLDAQPNGNGIAQSAKIPSKHETLKCASWMPRLMLIRGMCWSILFHDAPCQIWYEDCHCRTARINHCTLMAYQLQSHVTWLLH